MLYFRFSIGFIIKYVTPIPINTIATTSANEIHTGDNTHNHDQLMTLVNFNTMNTIVNRPVNPMPDVDVVDDVLPMFLIRFFVSSFNRTE